MFTEEAGSQWSSGGDRSRGGIDAMIQRAQSGVTVLPLRLASCLTPVELMELSVKENMCVQG